MEKKLYLPGGRLFRHYIDVFWFIAMSVALVVIVGYIPRNFLASLVLLLFPLCAVLTYLGKNRELVLREIETGLAKEQNHELVKDVLGQLNWRIKVNNKGFIEAYTNNQGFWTWSNQMVSVLITDNRIMFNSIYNPDSYRSQAITWGQNFRNRKKFRDLIEQLATQRICQ